MVETLAETITNLLDLQVPKDISISKDGRSLVYSTSLDSEAKNSEHQVSTVWFAESGKADSARQLTSGLFNDRSPAISPDGTTVVFISDRAKQGEASALYALSLSGGEPYPLTPAANERSIDAMKWSPDGRFIAFISADEKSDERKAKDKAKDDAHVWGEDWPFNRLRILHLDTRAIQTIVSIHEHIHMFDWSSKGSEIAFVTQPNPVIEAALVGGSKVYSISNTGKALQQVASFASMIYSIAYTDSTIHFTGSTSHDSFVGSVAVYKIDREEQDGFKSVAYGVTCCCNGVQRVGDDVLCHVLRGLDDEITMLEGRTLVELHNEIAVFDAAYTTNSEEVIIALVKSDINTPKEVYTITASGGALVRLSNHGAAYAGKDIAAATTVSCDTLDGNTYIEGILLTPTRHASKQGSPSKPLATIVEIHGGPYSRTTRSFNPSYYYFVNIYLNAGYAVLQPNYRGSSGRGHDFAYQARGGMGVTDEPDIIALTQHCIEKAYIDKDEIAVTGWSQGGHLSYLCSVRNGMHKFGWKFKAAIPGAGVTDWDAISFTSDLGFAEADYAGRGAWSTNPQDTGGRSGSAIWELNKAVEDKALPAILMLHGAQDVRVPIEQARAFRRGLQYHKIPFELVEYPREGHFIQERKHLEDMLTRSLRFIDQYLTRN